MKRFASIVDGNEAAAAVAYRTSHEVNMIAPMSDDDLRAVGDDKFVRQHRERAMSPDRPILRSTAQNPDVFFQAREACNPFCRAGPTIVQDVMDRFAKQAGRQYRLFEYYGPADAERLVILMGSGAGAAEEAVEVALDYESGTWEQLANSSRAIGINENLLPDLYLRSVERVTMVLTHEPALPQPELLES